MHGRQPACLSASPMAARRPRLLFPHARTRNCLRGEAKHLLVLLIASSLAVIARAGHRRSPLSLSLSLPLSSLPTVQSTVPARPQRNSSRAYLRHILALLLGLLASSLTVGVSRAAVSRYDSFAASPSFPSPWSGHTGEQLSQPPTILSSS